MNMPVTSGGGNSPIVHVKDGSVYANSRNVAGFFGKRNADVNRAIRDLIAAAPDNFGQRNFAPNEINDLTGQSVADYDMTKDGFVLLTFGFTGDDAMAFKLRYIEQFNAMEAELRKGEAAIDARHDGMTKMTAHKVAVIEKALLQTVSILDALAQRVDGLLVSHDPRVSAFHLTSAREMLDRAGVPSKGRNPLTRKFSHRLPSYAIRHGELPKRCQHSGKFLYSHELAERFMGEVGRNLIFTHMAKLSGQAVLAFPPVNKGPKQ